MKQYFKSHLIFYIILLLSFIGFYYIVLFHINKEIIPSLIGYGKVRYKPSCEAFIDYLQNGKLNLWIATVVLPFFLYIISYSYHNWCTSTKKILFYKKKPLLISFSEEIEMNKYKKLFLFIIVFILLWYIFLNFLLSNIIEAFLLLPVLLQFVQVIYHWFFHHLSFIYSKKHLKNIVILLFVCFFWVSLVFYSINDFVLTLISVISFFLPFYWIPFHYYFAFKTGKYLVILENAFN